MALKKEKKIGKWKTGKRHWPFKSPGIDFNQREKTCNNGRRCNQQWPPASLYLWSQKQKSVIRSSVFGEQGPFCPPWHWQALWNMYTDAPGTCTQMLAMWLRGEGWVAKSWNCWKSWNWLKLITIHCPWFPWNLQMFNGLQRSKIFKSDRLWWCNCYLDRKTDFWWFPLCHLPRILHKNF